ncbi:unnamed protein product [Camellia sinensis]
MLLEEIRDETYLYSYLEANPKTGQSDGVRFTHKLVINGFGNRDGGLRGVDFDYRCRGALEASMADREQIHLLEETVDESMASGIDLLTVSLYQMELDRTLFLLRSYLRIHLQKHWKLRNTWFTSIKLLNCGIGFLSKNRSLPKGALKIWKIILKICSVKIARLIQVEFKAISYKGKKEVPEPQLDSYVICRTKQSLGALQLDNSGEEDPMDLDPNDVYAVQYNSIKPLVHSGQIDLV